MDDDVVLISNPHHSPVAAPETVSDADSAPNVSVLTSLINQPTNHRDKVQPNLAYIGSAPLPNLKAALAKQRTLSGVGPQRNCVFYQGQIGSVQRDTDKFWRIKIPKLATLDGQIISKKVISQFNATLPRIVPLTTKQLHKRYRRNHWSVFEPQDDDRLVSVIMVVLRVHKPDEFESLYQWSIRPLVQPPGYDHMWVICHRCHQGHKNCGNPRSPLRRLCLDQLQSKILLTNWWVSSVSQLRMEVLPGLLLPLCGNGQHMFTHRAHSALYQAVGATTHHGGQSASGEG